MMLEKPPIMIRFFFNGRIKTKVVVTLHVEVWSDWLHNHG